jgi:nitrite reductase/ring-hydroxylating ferredoxin subunit
MAGFTKIAATSDIPLGEMRVFEIDLDSVVICHTDSGYFAVADECSHDSAPIGDGELEGEEIVCCRHGARFSVSDGSVTGPPALVGIDHYELKIEGDDILVKID